MIAIRTFKFIRLFIYYNMDIPTEIFVLCTNESSFFPCDDALPSVMQERISLIALLVVIQNVVTLFPFLSIFLWTFPFNSFFKLLNWLFSLSNILHNWIFFSLFWKFNFALFSLHIQLYVIIKGLNWWILCLIV